MTFKKATGIGAIVAVGALALSGCGTVGDGGGAAGGTAEDTSDVTIGFLQRQVDAPYYAAMQAEAEALAEEDGFDLLFQNAAGDPVTQLDQAQTLLSQGVDVLIVNAISPDTQRDQLEQIAGEVPLLFIDTSIPEVGFTAVGSNNEEIGQYSGELAAKRFDDGAAIDIAVINGGPNDEIVGPDRQKGFLAGLEAAGLSYTIVAEATGNYSQDEAVPATEGVLAAHPDVDLILGLNDAMALGALTVLRDQNNTTTVVSGVDGQKEALSEISEGGCEGQYASTALNSPSAATDRAFEIALQVATGEAETDDFEAIEYIEGAGVDCDNVDEYYDEDSVF
jgi:ribose transport system substrate-binding protein